MKKFQYKILKFRQAGEMTTVEAIRQADKLQKKGWIIISEGTFSMTLEKVIS